MTSRSAAAAHLDHHFGPVPADLLQMPVVLGVLGFHVVDDAVGQLEELLGGRLAVAQQHVQVHSQLDHVRL